VEIKGKKTSKREKKEKKRKKDDGKSVDDQVMTRVRLTWDDVRGRY